MLNVAQMTNEEQTWWYRIQDELVASRTMTEAEARAYATVCIERVRAYAQKIGTMAMPAYLAGWAEDMARQTGVRTVRVHHNYLPWIAALLVVRYGEAVEFWPDQPTEQDVQRARDFRFKGLPGVVQV